MDGWTFLLKLKNRERTLTLLAHLVEPPHCSFGKNCQYSSTFCVVWCGGNPKQAF